MIGSWKILNPLKYIYNLIIIIARLSDYMKNCAFLTVGLLGQRPFGDGFLRQLKKKSQKSKIFKLGVLQT